MTMMGNPMDLEILSGLDTFDDPNAGAMMGAAPQYMNMLAGYGGIDPYAAAVMGFSLNPFHYLKKGAGALGTGLSNVLHGHVPWHHAAAAGGGAALAMAAQARQAQLAQAAQYSQFAQPTPVNALMSPIPGASARGTKVQPLGFTNGTFTATSGTTLTVRARPQRPLRGGRLVGSFARAGTTATGLLTLVSLFVGTDGQLLSGDPISFDALAPNAFGVGVNLTPAAVGQEIVATVAISAAPTMTDTVTFNLTMFGYSIG